MKRRRVSPEVLKVQQLATERLKAYRAGVNGRKDDRLMIDAQRCIAEAIRRDRRTRA